MWGKTFSRLFEIFGLTFSQKIDFDISFKLSTNEMMFMKRQPFFSGININILDHLLIFLSEC